MGKQVRQPGELVREFILRNVEAHPHDVVSLTAAKFDCTRQAVHEHIKRLVAQGSIQRSGPRKKTTYKLAQLEARQWEYAIKPGISESDIYERVIFPELATLPKNVLGLWHYALTEMINNAIDHSGGTHLRIVLERTAVTTTLGVFDDGIGIFRKIQGELDLVDERLAILELSKGKLTTDPTNHTGQGIFFASRMVDQFAILSGGLLFDHERGKDRDWLIEREQPRQGTAVFMTLSNHTSRSTKKVFDEFSSKDDEYRFNKTIVPVSLAKIGPAELVSRSQAKRLLARVELFDVVVFDFANVETIGQAFADEIFRVYARSHPAISLRDVRANKRVLDMISRARSEPMGLVERAMAEARIDRAQEREEPDV
jgi:hypothetical protein